MKINHTKVQKKVYSQSNENRKFDSSPDEIIETVFIRLTDAGYFADSIGDKPLRQIIDACIVTACNAITSFDKDKFESDETYAHNWFALNDKFQEHTSDLCNIFRYYKYDNRIQRDYNN